jgi:type II secretory pathway component PulF
MGEFTYLARDRSGKAIEGRISAQSSAAAVGRLRAQGLDVERIRPVGSETPAAAAGKPFGSRIAEEMLYPVASGVLLRDAAVFFRQLATLIGAGLPLYQALASCESQTRNLRLKAILRECQAHTSAGGRLSEALERHRYVFSELQLSMIRAAEYGGTLEGTLDRLAGYLEKELALRRMISRLTLYPKLVALSALFILGRSFFTDGMPAISKLIVGSMGKMTYTGVAYLMDTALVLAVLVGLWMVGLAVSRTVLYRAPAAREVLERLKLAVPGIGGVVRGFALTRFGRAFGAMYAAGLPMAGAIRIAGDASGSYVIRRSAEAAALAVEQGQSMSDAFARAGTLSPIMLDMLRTGEQTGNMDQMMERVAEHLEGEAEMRAFQYSHVFSAVIYLTVAFLVGMAVVRFYAGYASGLGG